MCLPIFKLLKIKIMNNLNILKAMLLLAKTLNYSSTYVEDLILEIETMIKIEKKIRL